MLHRHPLFLMRFFQLLKMNRQHCETISKRKACQLSPLSPAQSTAQNQSAQWIESEVEYSEDDYNDEYFDLETNEDNNDNL